MAKWNKDFDIDTLTEDWIGITKTDDPIAWGAWMQWRWEQLKCRIEPKAFTVPSQYPPRTVAAAREYIAVLQVARKCIGWNDSRSKLPTDVSAWMG